MSVNKVDQIGSRSHITIWIYCCIEKLIINPANDVFRQTSSDFSNIDVNWSTFSIWLYSADKEFSTWWEQNFIFNRTTRWEELNISSCLWLNMENDVCCTLLPICNICNTFVRRRELHPLENLSWLEVINQRFIVSITSAAWNSYWLDERETFLNPPLDFFNVNS